MKIEILCNLQAQALLDDETFRHQSEQLARECPWATPFQSVDFVRTWYSCYRERFSPVVLFGRDETGNLDAFLLLASDCGSGELIHAGGWHAEYQCWLCRPGRSAEFVEGAMAAIWSRYPHAALELKYLPKGAETDWLSRSPLGSRVLHSEVPRPIMHFGDGSEIAASLKKRGNKGKLRDLRARGELELVLVNKAEQLEPFADEIIAIHDARHLAARGSAPFENDPVKWRFHMELLKIPNLLHATLLMTGDKLASVQIGLHGPEQMHLGLIAHDPWISDLSPGKFHFYFMGQLAMRQGLRSLDLTPGGESYKDRYATDWDQVGVMGIYPTRMAVRRRLMRDWLVEASRKALSWVNLTPSQARLLMIRLRHPSAVRLPGTAVSRACGWIYSNRCSRVYRLDLSDAAPSAKGSVMRRNVVADLLAYRPVGMQEPRGHFVGAALQYIERGFDLYTRVESGALSCAAFVHAGMGDKQWSELLGEPPDAPSAWLERIEVLRADGKSSRYEAALSEIIADLRTRKKVQRVHAVVKGSDLAMAGALTAAGFVAERESTCQTRFGRVHVRQARLDDVVSARVPSPVKVPGELVSEGKA